MDDKLEFIKSLDFFNSLNDKELNSLSNISTITKHKKHSILYYEDDSYEKIFFLVYGLLKIYKIDKFNNEIFLYHIYENSLISELTTLDGNDIYCFSNAEFMENSIILEVNFLEFKKQFLSINILKNEFINEILLKTQQLHSVVNRELVFDATAKVAFMLKNNLNMFNKLKRQEVSFMLHIQPETLSRVLKKLRRSEIIELDNSNIIVINQNTLEDIYKGDRL
jgi:CRP/FNR family transcriptional regulator